MSVHRKVQQLLVEVFVAVNNIFEKYNDYKIYNITITKQAKTVRSDYYIINQCHMFLKFSKMIDHPIFILDISFEDSHTILTKVYKVINLINRQCSMMIDK